MDFLKKSHVKFYRPLLYKALRFTLVLLVYSLITYVLGSVDIQKLTEFLIIFLGGGERDWLV